MCNDRTDACAAFLQFYGSFFEFINIRNCADVTLYVSILVQFCCCMANNPRNFPLWSAKPVFCMKRLVVFCRLVPESLYPLMIIMMNRVNPAPSFCLHW